MRRHYYYQRGPAWGDYFSARVVNKIIVANIIVFILQNLLPAAFTLFFALTPRAVVTNFYFWQPFTYMFLHIGFFHLFFNMLMTWFLGNTLEQVWGGRRFLKYYVACGLGGAAFSFIFAFNNPVIGASAAVFGLYLAYAMLFPNNYVYIYFLFPVKAKHLVTFLALLQLAMGLSGREGIAYFAHLGGMAAGLLFFKREIRNSWLGMKTRQRINNNWRRRHEEGEEQESAKIDSILDKIHSKGYEELSATEKRILENYSRKQREDSE